MKPQEDPHAFATIAEAETEHSIVRVLRAPEADQHPPALSYRCVIFAGRDEGEETPWQNFDGAMADFTAAIRFDEIEGRYAL